MRPIILSLVVLIAVALFAASSRPVSLPTGSSGDDQQRAIADTRPIIVDCICEVPWGPSWKVTIDKDRTVQWMSCHGGKKDVKWGTFQLSEAQLTGLNHTIEAQLFFELRNNYGPNYFDCTEARLSISRGGQPKEVSVHAINSQLYAVPEVKRAFTVVTAIRNLMPINDALDLRPQN